MSEQIKVDFTSVAEAADSMVRLFDKLDSHQMYSCPFFESAGDARDQMGYLTDEFNAIKTSIGQLIDGTRIALCYLSEEYKNADQHAAKMLSEVRAALEVDPDFVDNFNSGYSGGFSYSKRDSNGNEIDFFEDGEFVFDSDIGEIEGTIDINGFEGDEEKLWTWNK